jgi:hypothetical protein
MSEKEYEDSLQKEFQKDFEIELDDNSPEILDMPKDEIIQTEEK